MSQVRIRIDGEGPFPSRFAEGPLEGPWGLWRLVAMGKQAVCLHAMGSALFVYKYECGATIASYDDAVRWVQEGWRGICDSGGENENDAKGGTEVKKRRLVEQCRALQAVLDPIRQHDRPMLRKVATHLKQRGGEDWAVGELLERACIHLDACQLAADRERERDAKKGYNPPPAHLPLPKTPPPPLPPKFTATSRGSARLS